MRFSIFILPLVVLLSLSVQAEEKDYKDMALDELGQFKNYVINDVDVRVPVFLVNNAMDTMSKVATSLSKCEASTYEVKNPIVRRSNTFEIIPSSTGCRLKYQRLGVITYVCLLTSKKKSILANEWSKLSQSPNVLGDLTDVEQSILFDSGICKH